MKSVGRGGVAARLEPLLLFAAAAIVVIWYFGAPGERDRRPFARLAASGVAGASASPNAFGASGELKLRFALPGDDVEFPIQVGGDPASLAYEWIPASDTTPTSAPRRVSGAYLTAPDSAGLYRLALVSGGGRQIMSSPLLAVMVPFAEKVNGILNGYRIGTYLSERFRRRKPTDPPPDGFVEVSEHDADLPVSAHFRLRDFLTHDSQDEVWPKYVALDPRLLDKLELVLAKLAGQHGDTAAVMLSLDVHSGFRTPLHNASVFRSARDSRHEYGDAADVAIDADGCGRVTLHDELLVQRAVDEVEAEHPDLVGGLGLYVSQRYRSPYVHIDARGWRTRWRG